MTKRKFKKSIISGTVASALILSLATPAAFANEDGTQETVVEEIPVNYGTAEDVVAEDEVVEENVSEEATEEVADGEEATEEVVEGEEVIEEETSEDVATEDDEKR